MAEKDPSARLRRAVKENNLFLVKRLIERTDIRNPDPGPRRYTSLAWAAVLGHEETFEFLLSEGHDDYEYSRDSENNTILMLLAELKPTSSAMHPSSGDNLRATLRMARLYYDRYPKVLDWSNNQGKTALHVAALKGKEELVRMFCDLGADVDLPDNKGNSPLHTASAWGHVPVVQLLVERGCSHIARNNDNFTPADYAYSFTTQETLMDTVRLQFENNKRSRRKLTQKQSDPGTSSPSYHAPRSLSDVDPPRMRSGSGTSRTTDASDEGLAPPPSQSSASSRSLASGSHTPLQGNGNMSALSPIASRVQQADADAREKYMKGNRNRSESQGTSSTDNYSQSGSSLAPNDADEILGLPSSARRLRPSMSASQLTSGPRAPTPNTKDNRIRSGTTESQRPVLAKPLVGRASSISTGNGTTAAASANGRSPVEKKLPPFPGKAVSSPQPAPPETYTGPSSQYAQFPEPPAEEASTPTAKRMAFKPFVAESLTPHRRGLSSSSFRV
ncbi:ankyrin [Cylindrobasidium torrendii FP15055 ss-10]|uniref:Ankyrin n=1 Tax=Cylindrobasidium torrendii FP15055 ss-10 TaxID=1314674 RepID=A0A0D7BV85_9AGAR|nr:ankyrin [Cylindrobasidium torrendii FP15055 ss-10]